MTLTLVTAASASFANHTYDIYCEGKSSGAWDGTLPWEKAPDERIPSGLREDSWLVASASSYMEQIGLATAADLCARATSFPLKLALAQAAADEARHAECFARYALSQKDHVRNYWAFANEIQELFALTSDESEIFLCHTYLEMLAMTQFTLVRRPFKGYFLGTLYQHVLQDEARHVAFGTDYFQALAQSDPNKHESIKRFFWSHRDAMFPDQSSLDFVATLAGLSSKQVLTRFERYEARFLGHVHFR